MSVTVHTRPPGCPSPASRGWLHSLVRSSGGRSSGGRALLSLGRTRSSAGIAQRAAAAGGGRSRSGNNYTTAAAHHRPLSLFVNPYLRGVLRGWRPPGRGEGMEPARDTPCPRSGPPRGSAEAAARWCEAPGLGLRRGAALGPAAGACEEPGEAAPAVPVRLYPCQNGDQRGCQPAGSCPRPRATPTQRGSAAAAGPLQRARPALNFRGPGE